MRFLLQWAWHVFGAGLLLQYLAGLYSWGFKPFWLRFFLALNTVVGLVPLTLIIALVLSVPAIFVLKQQKSWRLFAVLYGVASAAVSISIFTGDIYLARVDIDMPR